MNSRTDNSYYILWFPYPTKGTKILANDLSKGKARNKWNQLIQKAEKLNKCGVLRLYRGEGQYIAERYVNCEVPER